MEFNAFSVLRSDIAIQTSVLMVRAFVAMRQLITAVPQIDRVEQLEQQMKELKDYIEEVTIRGCKMNVSVSLRFTLNRRMKRLSTSLFATSKDLTKDLRIKQSSPLKQEVNYLIQCYQNKCNKPQIKLSNYMAM